jgi:hypothetical protein
MKIEILYPEVANLFGDSQNIQYLKLCLPEAEFIETDLNARPAFADQDVDMVYMGPMTEKTQEKVIDRLRPFTDRLREMIDRDVLFLLTGNAGEVFLQQIHNVTYGTTVPGLNLFDLTVETDMFHRYNGKTLGTFEDIEVVGFRSQFSMIYGENASRYFLACERGIGLNPQSSYEGLHVHHFFATAVLGPILPLNPLFTKKLLQLLDADPSSLALEQEAMQAYEARRTEFHLKHINFND